MKQLDLFRKRRDFRVLRSLARAAIASQAFGLVDAAHEACVAAQEHARRFYSAPGSRHEPR